MPANSKISHARDRCLNTTSRRQLLIKFASASVIGLTAAMHALAQPNRALKKTNPINHRIYRIYAITWRGKTQVEKGLEDYLAGRGIAVEFIWRDAAQNPAKLEEFAQEIKAMQKQGDAARPDLIYTWGTPPTLGIAGTYDSANKASSVHPSAQAIAQTAAQTDSRYITDVPILFAVVAAPVAAKVVASLTNQGRDITGIYHVAAVDAQIEAMRNYRKFSTVGVLYNAAEANSLATVDALRKLGTTQKFSVIEATFDLGMNGKAVPTGIEDKILALKNAGAEWLYLGPDSFLFSQIDRVAAAALANRIPTFSATEGALNVNAPVLAGLVSSYYAIGQFAAFKAEQILVHGKRARDIPIETLSRYSYIVRIEVAKQLDILPPIALFNIATIR